MWSCRMQKTERFILPKCPPPRRTYYPLRVEFYRTGRDSGGAGYNRGGNCNEKMYVSLADGKVSIHDDRAKIHPWGINGGQYGSCSKKVLFRSDGTEEELGSKVDGVLVEKGDRVLFITGGWGDPLDREYDRVVKDVRRGLVSVEKAERDYGVVINMSTMEVDTAASDALREKMKKERGPVRDFDFGPKYAHN